MRRWMGGADLRYPHHKHNRYHNYHRDGNDNYHRVCAGQRLHKYQYNNGDNKYVHQDYCDNWKPFL